MKVIRAGISQKIILEVYIILKFSSNASTSPFVWWWYVPANSKWLFMFLCSVLASSCATIVL